MWATACLLPLRADARGDADERLLSRPVLEPPKGVIAGDDPRGVFEQALEPLVRTCPGAAGEVVAGVLPPVDVDLPSGWRGSPA